MLLQLQLMLLCVLRLVLIGSELNSSTDHIHLLAYRSSWCCTFRSCSRTTNSTHMLLFELLKCIESR
jgi:hypothetical protein